MSYCNDTGHTFLLWLAYFALQLGTEHLNANSVSLQTAEEGTNNYLSDQEKKTKGNRKFVNMSESELLLIYYS